MNKLENPNTRQDLRPYLWKPDHICSMDAMANRIGADFTDKIYVLYTYSPLQGDLLSESNYRSMLRYLRDTFHEYAEYVTEQRTNHWTYAYFDSICIDVNAPEELLSDVAYFMNGMEGYPVFDESDFSELQCEAVCDGWENASIKERIELCAESGVSIFASRRDDVPQDSGYIWEYFTS